MPEESDEGVYRTFHGQASVQVLNLILLSKQRYSFRRYRTDNAQDPLVGESESFNYLERKEGRRWRRIGGRRRGRR